MGSFLFVNRRHEKYSNFRSYLLQVSRVSYVRGFWVSSQIPQRIF